MYAAIISTTDIAFAVGEVSNFFNKPNQSHVNAVKRIVRYLQGTMNFGIVYGTENKKSEGYTDADFARNSETRKSTTGYIFMLGGGPITWRSYRQSVVALSTTESGYIAACEGEKEVWLRKFLGEISTANDSAVPLYIDNQSAIHLIKNHEVHHRTKHVDVRLHSIRDLYEKGVIDVVYRRSGDQFADLSTKPSRDVFLSNVQKIGLNSVTSGWKC
ncbi:hypothetical protein JTB14_012272 [Gonioctena quinquepunctata]|nr:hypothetical protein JTB14_012272 [Gonioctena quinquepunctata]